MVAEQRPRSVLFGGADGGKPVGTAHGMCGRFEASDIVNNCRLRRGRALPETAVSPAAVPASLRWIQARRFLHHRYRRPLRDGLNVEIKTAVQDIPPRCRPGTLHQGLLRTLAPKATSADVDICGMGADSEAGDDDPFDDLVRVDR
jgi:hypothetical protein